MKMVHAFMHLKYEWSVDNRFSCEVYESLASSEVYEILASPEVYEILASPEVYGILASPGLSGHNCVWSWSYSYGSSHFILYVEVLMEWLNENISRVFWFWEETLNNQSSIKAHTVATFQGFWSQTAVLVTSGGLLVGTMLSIVTTSQPAAYKKPWNFHFSCIYQISP